MTNDLIHAVSIALNAAFGEGYTVYKNDVQQGLKAPCFFIAILNPSMKPRLHGRYFSENPFDIRYFSEKAGDNGEMADVAQRLMDTLSFVTLENGDMVRGTRMRYEIKDGILHFFVSYNLFAVKPAEKTIMESLEIKQA